MGSVKKVCKRLFPLICALILLGSSTQAYAVPYRRAISEEKRIALTFDDGPNEEKTREILEILAEYQVTATFFVIGKNAEACPDRIRQIYDAGHEIGNHTFNHKYLTKMSEEKIREEVQKTQDLLTEICGERPVVFRPPGGYWSPETISVVENMGYECVMWSVDTRDWSIPSVETIVKRVERDTKGGDIILFHDLGDKRLPTPNALRVLLPYLIKEGYEFVTVSQLLQGEMETVTH